MNAQSVTVHLPGDILQRLQKQANAMQHSIDEKITEALLEYWSDSSRWVETTDQDNDLFRVEEATFRTHHKIWLKEYADQYIAVLGSELVDHDSDLASLTQRLYNRFGDQPIWIAPLQENPVEEWAMRSPRIKQSIS